MPELPEVESFRRVVDSVAAGRAIVHATCANDRIVFDEHSPVAVARALRGRTVVACERRGKYVWIALDRRPWLLVHFGMTGAFRTPTAPPLELASRVARGDPTWPPRFTKLRLELDDGGELVMTDARRFGRVRLRKNPPCEPPVSELGFDPLLDLPTAVRFRALLGRRRGNVKAVLLDQGFAAGVGNWIADEVLYQARIDPRRTIGTLTPEEQSAVHRALGNVVRAAVRVDARKEKLPREWLFHRRWGRAGGTTAEGDPIEHTTVAGRSTAWVPARQK